MKIWHAAALALAGWYLLTPYINSVQPGQGDHGSQSRVLYNQSWEQTGAYDTAAACEKALVAVISQCSSTQYDSYHLQLRSQGKDPEHPQRPDTPEVQGYYTLLRKDAETLCDAAESAVCWASDDPRLKR